MYFNASADEEEARQFMSKVGIIVSNSTSET